MFPSPNLKIAVVTQAKVYIKLNVQYFTILRFVLCVPFCLQSL